MSLPYPYPGFLKFVVSPCRISMAVSVSVLLRSSIIEEDNVMLIAPFTTMEITDVVFFMHPDKAPGPDGMNPTFFQHYWHILGQDVCTACLSFISNCAIPEEINSTHIVLILKKKYG